MIYYDINDIDEKDISTQVCEIQEHICCGKLKSLPYVYEISSKCDNCKEKYCHHNRGIK
jgi:hypothetical protein